MFERIAVPTPFQVGAVNAYLAGRTLVDPGPDSQRAWGELRSELSEAGLVPEDVERVLVTHPHPDHFGLAGRFRERGASVVASPEAAPILADFEGRLAYEGSFFEPFLVRHGLDERAASTVVDLAEAFLEFAPSVTVDNRLEGGDHLSVDGRTVEVLGAEGHAPGELVFAHPLSDGEEGDARRGDDGAQGAVVGDQVLADITPNPLLQPPPEEGGDRPSTVAALNRSLAALRDRGFDRLLPGHREEIADPAARIDAILAAHEERTETVAGVVDGPTTAVEVMEALFGDLPATELFPGMSEAVGHLDLLEERGVLRQRDDGETVRYEPV